jgi:pimeloyl-ACP methyl ester carboxylesterase
MKLTIMILAALLGCLALGFLTSLYLFWRIVKDNPAEGRLIDVEGGRVHVVQRGDEGKEAIVLIHGASSNSADLLLALGDHLSDHHIIAIDRPGHGWSDRLSPNADTLAFQAQTIIKVLDALKIDQAVFVGHSYAGAVALRIGLDEPKRVKGMVLLGPVSHPWSTGVEWYYHFAASPFGFLLNHTIITPLGHLMMDKAVRGVFAPQTPPLHYIAKAKIALAVLPKAFRANAQDMVVLAKQVQDQKAFYPCFKPALTIIVGKQDKTVSPDIHARTLVKQIPHAILRELDQTGHQPHYAQPERVAAEIMRFTARQTGLIPSAALSSSSDCRN